MDTQNGRTVEQTELLAAELRPAGAGRTDLRTDFHAGPRTDLGFAEPVAGVEAGGESSLGTALESGLENGLESGLETAVGPDGAEDPAWDYEDVILRSVN
ncbi:hypothetical protein [Kitasatospora cineracea]|uniref:Uncharacterized protein n=1 Tax=Kitasatospora cineracea TaxID=88074 RepID=A0A8G1U9U2_9ACTN|nr:hypothetical protein [Kitasatospora cineracea]ROR35510.1 hypothetical protein EDD39_7169 [Kitasatospora cineracea]